MKMSKIENVIELLNLLSETSEGLSLEEIMDKLDISRRTAERLRDTIDYQIVELRSFEPDGRTKKWRIEGKLSPTFFTPTAKEIAALNSEISSLEKSGQNGRADNLKSLYSKILNALDSKARDARLPSVDALKNAQKVFLPAGPAINVPPETFAAIQQAIIDNRMVEYLYDTDYYDEPVWRCVIPCGLVHGQISYLIGAMPDSEHGPSTYRLDRMSAVKVSERIGSPPKEFDLEEWMSQSFGLWMGEKEQIKLRILPHAAQKGRNWRFHPKQVLTECDDGSLLIEFEASGLYELAVHLCGWAGEVNIISPQALKDELYGIFESDYGL